MHVLTKIFIVLVSLLAILLVPLVVAYAANEDTYRARWQDVEGQLQAERQLRSSAERAHSAQQTELESQVAEKRSEIRSLNRENDDLRSQIRRVQSDLTQVRAEKAAVEANIATFSSALDGNQEMNRTLLAELSSLRQQAIEDAETVVELDEALRDVSSQLEVADAARRALQEEIQRMQDDEAALTEQLGRYIAQFGDLGDAEDVRVADRAVAPTRNLQAQVLNVRRTEEQTLVEINVGSRDGVEEDWSMIVGSGRDFIGNLRIIEVDISTSVGVLTLEDPDSRGRVEVGHTVYARRGEV